MAAAKCISNNGTFPLDLPGKDFFLNARMVQLPSLMAIADLFDVDLYLSLFPLLAFYLVFFTLLVVHSQLESLSLSFPIRSGLILASLLFFGVPAYLYHSFYFHTNLLTACYYCAGIFAIFYYIKTPRPEWVFLAAVFLAATTLTRISMLYFVFIPITILIGLKKPDNRHFFLFLIPFVLITYGWQLFRLSLVGLDTGYHNIGGAELGSLPLLLILAVFTVSDKLYHRITRHSPLIAVIGLLILLASLAVKYPSGLTECMSYLYKILFFNLGQAGWGWGWFWALFVIVFFADLPRNKFPEEKALCYVLLMFALFRVIIYTTPMVSGDSNVFSGSRILLHIFPVAVSYLIIALGNRLKSNNWDIFTSA